MNSEGDKYRIVSILAAAGASVAEVVLLSEVELLSGIGGLFTVSS